MDFVITGYDSIRRDRGEGSGGGCVTFVKQGLQYRVLGKGTGLECVIVEIWTKVGNMEIVHFYNPGNRMTIEMFDEISVHLGGKGVWCGDFNAHSTLWGGRNDENGIVVEELMESRNLVCFNDGSGTRINIRSYTSNRFIGRHLFMDCDQRHYHWQ